MYFNLRDLTDILTNPKIPESTRNSKVLFLHRWARGARDMDWVTGAINDDGCEIVAFAEVHREKK